MNKLGLLTIIILLIGAFSVSGINGYLGTEEASCVYLNNDYLLGYWKLNEGSGNIAHDSSGNNFDGTIYGASWVDGYSGYALEFDGVNDYVDLDDYAQYQLGFNKTDDLIFTVFFNTTSDGIIYSVSKSDSYNPGVHIAINPNGTLEFKVWKSNCGISLSTNGVYNDGLWHNATIIYNGISANPIVSIYIDGDLDISIEHWVCFFYADQFGKAKMGRRAHNTTNYFDGKVDELKIIKYAGGNKQSPPEITGPETGMRDEELEFTFVTNDPEGDDIWLYIDWDDGGIDIWDGPYKSGEEVIKTHKWKENGSYTITAKSKDIWGESYHSYFDVLIGNQPPSAPSINGPGFGEEDESLTYKFISYDNENDKIQYTIDWGDGTNYTTIFYESGKEIGVAHKWLQEGDYNITAKATDTHEGESDLSEPFLVIIGNDAPGIPTITGPTRVKLGIEYPYTFSATDSENDRVYYDIDWGDGSEVLEYGPYESGERPVIKHIWEKRFVNKITARAKDVHDFWGDYGYLKVIVSKEVDMDSAYAINNGVMDEKRL